VLEYDDLPLTGMLVLDFSQFLAGPVAALRLADLGARVVKIERPNTGEIGRTLAFGGRWADGDTLSFHAMNRNKEAVVADLKDPDDLAAVAALVDRADVLIQNFRPGVMARLGLDHETVCRRNPGLVYASASGYGAEGPWVDRPGQDLLAQAVSGLPWLNGDGDRPVPVGLAIADHLMSCHIAQGVVALLVRKVRTGRGGHVETSLLEAMLDLQLDVLTSRLNGVDPTTAGGARPVDTVPAAPSGLYPTADGHLALAMTPVGELGRLLDSPALAAYDDPARWWASREDIDRTLREVLASATTEHWVEVLEGTGAWCAPLVDLDSLLGHAAFTAIGMTQQVERAAREQGGEPVRITTVRSPIRIDGERLLSARAAPRLGQDGHVRDGRLAATLADTPGAGRTGPGR
jgi:CoA:oxalate CoA-transferase